jgi:NAD(P)-dependent dehydrogenase (short-subunit alcohol dehydrogenase family)
VTDRFAGKTALVTGAGRGIGRAVALGLADAGADLILLARSSDQLEATRAELADRGMARGRILVIATDLGDEGLRTQAMRSVLARGRVDILINNAATVEPLGTTAAIPSADVRQAFEVNVIAPAAFTAAMLPGMTQAGWGRIVNVSSGIVAHPEAMVRGNAYAATKAALEAHTVNLAAELRGTGVTANVFRPGRVDTAMQEWIRGQDPDRIGAALHGRFTKMYSERALITPEQSARALLVRLQGLETGAIWDVDDLAAAPIPKTA